MKLNENIVDDFKYFYIHVFWIEVEKMFQALFNQNYTILKK